MAQRTIALYDGKYIGNKILKLIDKHVGDISSTESTKSGSLVEALVSEYRK